MTHQYRETDWFSATTPPVRAGVYKTRHRGSDGVLREGYSSFKEGFWGYIYDSIDFAARTQHYKSQQQSKEWKGIYE